MIHGQQGAKKQMTVIQFKPFYEWRKTFFYVQND